MSKKDNKNGLGPSHLHEKGYTYLRNQLILSIKEALFFYLRLNAAHAKRSTGLYGNTVLTINNYSHEKVEN